MRLRMILGAVLTASLAGVGTPAVQAQEGYRHGRLRFLEPGVSLQRASDVAAEEAFSNTPFLPGDRVWTDGSGRVEFQFPDGSVVRVDRRSKIDYAGHEEDQGERIVLRLWSGSVFLRVRPRGAERFEIETPAGTVRGVERSHVRIDVDAGEARVSVYEGEAVLNEDGDRVRLAAGERTYARWGGRVQEPERFDLYDRDDFAQWDADRESEGLWDGRSAAYLPQDLDVYAGELETYGEWRSEPAIGYIWIPRVEVGWRPYWNGHWAWTPYGWTWIPNERWGWAPFHYGRWDFTTSFGWYWIPDRTWGPAWVSWASGGGYVGWCPLGRHDRPAVPWDRRDRDWRLDRGHAVPRNAIGGFDGRFQAWSVVREGELGRGDLAVRRVAIDRIAPTTMRVADSARLRPTRDGRSLREDGAVPRAMVSTRPRPGDFVRELAVDNKTTIPSPWFRRGGNATSRSDQGPRFGQAASGAEPRSEPRQSAMQRAPWFSPAAGGSDSAHSNSAARREPESSERRAPRPWSGSAVTPMPRESDPPDSGRHVGSAERRSTTVWRGPAPVREREAESEPARTPAFRPIERQREEPARQPRVWGGEPPRHNDESAHPRAGSSEGHPGGWRPYGGDSGAHQRGGDSRPSGHEARPSGGDAPRDNNHAVGRPRPNRD